MMRLIEQPLDETVNRFFEEAAVKGFEKRDGQIEMANEICKAITEKRPLAVEAEVGIGKSFAYLVPALIQYFRERRQVVIATSTIALQEQLYHDAQSVLKMLGVHANIILAKGMKNYACMKRVHSLYSRHKNDIYYGRLWQTVHNGQQDKAEITMNISDTEWDKISISNFGKDQCKSCPYTRSCQYHKMRSGLVYENAIVICNQNMLVSHLMNQLKGKGLFTPSVNTFIIDEAHNIESKFRSAYTTAYSKSDIVNVISESVRNIRNSYMKELAEEIKMELEELFRMFRVQVQKQESESDGDVTSFFLEMNKDIKNKLIVIRRKLASLNCRRGKIDRIYTKSISRFARNTKDCLKNLRELKALGITVFFEKENIDTANMTDEIMITILGGLAQEESVSISQNTQWAIQKRMKN